MITSLPSVKQINLYYFTFPNFLPKKKMCKGMCKMDVLHERATFLRCSEDVPTCSVLMAYVFCLNNSHHNTLYQQSGWK